MGLTIYDKPFQEDLIRRIGHASEQATEWHRRTPDLSQLHR
jgi:Asp-tRNA(Asn)/Glu-tRNA(Gln) amidotransferase A subunit family amidase